MRALILDYGGVVFHQDPADYDAIGARHGIPAGVLWSAFHSIPEYLPSRVGAISRDQFYQAVRDHLTLGVGAGCAAAAIADLSAYYQSQVPVRPVMQELLVRLRGVVALALLSNATRGFTDSLRSAGVTGLFDVVACSAEIGLAKPDPRAFQHVSDALGVVPGECLFVDDTAQYADAARACGMAALHYHQDRHDELLRALRSTGLLDL